MHLHGPWSCLVFPNLSFGDLSFWPATAEKGHHRCVSSLQRINYCKYGTEAQSRGIRYYERVLKIRRNTHMVLEWCMMGLMAGLGVVRLHPLLSVNDWRWRRDVLARGDGHDYCH